MSDGQLSCAIFLTIAVGIPLAVVGTGLLIGRWRDRPDAITRERCRELAEVVYEAARSTVGAELSKRRKGAGCELHLRHPLLRITTQLTKPQFVSIEVEAAFDLRRTFRLNMKKLASRLEWAPTLYFTSLGGVPPTTRVTEVGWSQLQDAYGSAGDVPGWLEAMTPAGDDEVWEELWSRLCHQGSVYTASFAALPLLRERASEWRGAERVMPLVLAGSIVSGHAQSSELEQLYAESQQEIQQLHDLTKETLATTPLDRESFIVLLQSLLAFENVPVWSSQLEGLNVEELEARCPQCGEAVLVAIGSDGFFTADSDYVTKIDVVTRPLRPATPERLTGIGERLHTIAMDSGQREVATLITYAFGEATCPLCEADFVVAEELAADD